MKPHLYDRIPFSKIALILSVTAILSLGTCGIGMAVSDGGNRQGSTGKLMEFVLIVGVAGFWLSILGLVLLTLLYVALYIARDIAHK